MKGPTVLSLAGITKRFDSSTALENVSLDVRVGTVHALLGENGAGKTTLMRIAFGMLSPDAGTVTVRNATRVSTPGDAIRAGLGMVHQHFTNVPAMTVAENVALGGAGRFVAGRVERQVAEIGERSGLVLDPRAKAGDLSVGAQQRLEIVKALARDASILILDEPTAVLVPDEIDDLLRWLRGFADAGNAVVLITHKLREALEVADDVTVLRRGRVASQASVDDVTIDSLSRALFGEDLASSQSDRGSETRGGSTVVLAEKISVVGDRVRRAILDASFEIRSGEIIGVAAVEGAGQRELLRALAGRTAISEGRLTIPASVGFVPEDRHRDGLILELSTTENVALKNVGRRRGRMRWPLERQRTSELIALADVRGADADTPIRNLSGGNQQKLILARELGGNPPLLVVENPSRGLDMRATRAVHDRLRAVAESGAAVVVYSSDLDEVMLLATRVLVVYAGTVRECVRDRETIARAMVGVA